MDLEEEEEEAHDRIESYEYSGDDDDDQGAQEPLRPILSQPATFNCLEPSYHVGLGRKKTEAPWRQTHARTQGLYASIPT